MLAANSSGAQVIQNDPLQHFTPNIKMNLELIDLCNNLNVKKLIFISSNTVYPQSNKKMKEKDVKFHFFEKYYVVGWMKAFSEVICDIYSNYSNKRKLEILIVRPSNLYGPYDKFSQKKSKVIAALIRKFTQNKDKIEIWGDGSDVKDFLYIEDFCDALIHVFRRFKKFEVINICSGRSIKLNHIIKLLCQIFKIKYENLYFNSGMPTMIPVRKMDDSLLRSKYKYTLKTNHKESLLKTISWYQKNFKIYDRF